MTSKLGRFIKLGSMTASVAGHYLGARLAGTLSKKETQSRRISHTHERVGEILARTLGDLKGPVMKIGQMASISTGLLPIEISSALAVLRRSVPFAPYKVIEKQIANELGEPPERLFKKFSSEPFAAASIGQVHRAVTDDGRDAVVKVQYPEVSSSVNADLGQLRLALRAAGFLKDRRENLDQFFQDIAAQLREELDYCKEADNVRMMAAFHRARHPDIHVPEVIAERSSGRVLTLSFEAGEELETAAAFTQEARDRLGELLVKRVFAEILELGALHADPNPANFGFRPDGTFALYDFGCVKCFTKREKRGLGTMLRGVLEDDCDLIEEGLVAVGVRNLEGPPIDAGLYRRVLNVLAPALTDGPFEMGAAAIHRDFVSMVPKMRRYTKSFNITAGMMLVQRVNVGTYGNLRKLGARVRLRKILEEACSRKSTRAR